MSVHHWTQESEGAMRVLRLIANVGLLFLALCTWGCSCCESEYENMGYRPSQLQHDRRMNELNDQEESLDNESEWLVQEEQALASEWKVYKDLEAEFTSSLNEEQLDALGELLKTDSPAQIEASIQISDVLSTERSNELDVLLAKKSDLKARSAELENKKRYHDLLVLQHERRVQTESSATIRPRRPDVKKRTSRPTGIGAAMAARQRMAAQRRSGR